MEFMTFHLGSELKKPLYTQLYQHVKHEIQIGRLNPGEKLPSKRKLSTYLQISQNTVQAAYDQLMIEGYIYAVSRSGYYVSAIEELTHLDIPESEKEEAINAYAYRYNFSHGGVDLENFPFQTWKRINNEVLNERDLDLLVQGDPQGYHDLRFSISNYLHQSRGVICTENQIIVSSGTEFLLQLLIQLLGKRNVFALENPGYEKLNLIFDSNGVPYVPIPLDASGMTAADLSRSSANIAYITPSHQFPTGVVMPIQRRVQLLNWAHEASGRYIIEDDYDSEFKYSGKPIPAMQGLDGGEKVIYIGSFSKSLTPGLRISYMVLPEALIKLYRERLSFYICPVPMAQQKCLDLFIGRGHFERHLNKMRNIYKRKRELLVAAIESSLKNIDVLGANAGLHMLLRVNNGMTEEELVDSAARKGLKVCGISRYYLSPEGGRFEPVVLLGYAAVTEIQIAEAVALFKEAWC